MSSGATVSFAICSIEPGRVHPARSSMTGKRFFIDRFRIVLSFAIVASVIPLPIAPHSAAAEASKRVSLFNGRNLDGWVVEGTKENKKSGQPQPVWSARDGAIHCEGTGFGFLRYDKQFCDFTLHVEYRLTPGCNSGIGIRSVKYTGKSQTRPSFAAYEIQLLDDGDKQPGKHSTASLYRYVAPRSLPVKKPGEWNEIEIECRGPWIKITLNGDVVLNIDQSKIDEIKNKPLCGYVSVQNHGKTIDFRNLWLTEHSSAAAGKH
jgi:hypothetical protein